MSSTPEVTKPVRLELALETTPTGINGVAAAASERASETVSRVTAASDQNVIEGNRAVSRWHTRRVWSGERRWNGVPVLARRPPVLTRVELPDDASDAQPRYLEAADNGVLLASI